MLSSILSSYSVILSLILITKLVSGDAAWEAPFTGGKILVPWEAVEFGYACFESGPWRD